VKGVVIRAGVATLLCACSSVLWAAQQLDYPTRPVRMIVGFASGGGLDATARPVNQKLSTILGQQVILDNRPGAGGNIATEIVSRAEPNGYTLLLVAPAFAINAGLHEKLPFNPVTDFTGVTQLVESMNIVSVHPSVAASSVKELVALAKTKTLNYGSSGVGTIGHLAGELFNVMAGTRLTHVAYKGGGPVLADLIGGHIHLVFASAGSVMPQIKAGKIRGIAVTTTTRSALLPNVPTVAESGLPGYEAKNWYGVLAPARTPSAVVQRLSYEIGGVLGMADVRATLLAQGLDPAPSSASQFTTYVRAEIAKWAKVVKAAGVKPE
jgi:tripartite-type tricarboxylate transporter receptor subunit TctC